MMSKRNRHSARQRTLFQTPAVLSWILLLVAATGSAQTPQADVQAATQAAADQPVLLMHFDEPNDSSQVLDASGCFNHGQLLSAPAGRTDAGRFGRALQLDGNHEVTIPESSLHFVEPFTIAAWIYPQARNENMVIISNHAAFCGWSNYLIMLSDDNRLAATISFPDGYKHLRSTGQVPARQWSHVALVYNTAYMNLYLNGDPVGRLETTGFPCTLNDPVLIGALDNPQGPLRFKGRIDELCVWKGAKTTFNLTGPVDYTPTPRKHDFIDQAVHEPEAPGIALVTDHTPQAAILLSAKSTSVEQHAARELAKYVKLMTNAEMPILTDDAQTLGDWKNLVLIGRPETHPAIHDLCEKNFLRLSGDYPGLDGFVIETIANDKLPHRYLVLGGSQDRGTLYAVYDLLERVYHVGFFEDGEYIPTLADLHLGRLRVCQRPAFKVRQFMQGCSGAYTACDWLFPEWQYQCDYGAKRRQNLIWVQMPHEVANLLRRQTEADFGVEAAPAGPLEKAKIDLTSQVHRYVRSQLDTDCIGPSYGAFAAVSAAFRKKRPDLHYIEIYDYDGNVRLAHLDPRTPEFAEYVRRYLQRYIENFGKQKYYWVALLAEESHLPPNKDPELDKTIRADYARGVIQGIHQADPDGAWYCGGWGFNFGAWNTSLIKQLCDACPADAFLTDSLWSEVNPSYKSKYSFFFGKPWLLGILHAFGGDETLFGDVNRMQHMFRDVLESPQATNCVGSTVQPEIVHHNPLFYDFVYHLSWNPYTHDVQSFLLDYANRRYGVHSGPQLRAALAQLVESVYGPTTYVLSYPPTPLYRRILGGEPLGNPGSSTVQQAYLKRTAYIPKLRQAVEIMIAEAPNQQGNQLYDNDLVDVCKQYLAEIINYNLIELYQAFEAADQAKFDARAQRIDTCFDNLTLILSSNSRYFLETEIRRRMKREQALGLTDLTGEPLYQKMSAIVRHYAEPAREYLNRDRLELVKHYYHPKTQIYIDTLRERMAQGLKDVALSDMMDRYQQLAQGYYDNDVYNLTAGDVYPGTVAEAAATVLAHVEENPNEM